MEHRPYCLIGICYIYCMGRRKSRHIARIRGSFRGPRNLTLTKSPPRIGHVDFPCAWHSSESELGERWICLDVRSRSLEGANFISTCGDCCLLTFPICIFLDFDRIYVPVTPKASFRHNICITHQPVLFTSEFQGELSLVSAIMSFKRVSKNQQRVGFQVRRSTTGTPKAWFRCSYFLLRDKKPGEERDQCNCLGSANC